MGGFEDRQSGPRVPSRPVCWVMLSFFSICNLQHRLRPGGSHRRRGFGLEGRVWKFVISQSLTTECGIEPPDWGRKRGRYPLWESCIGAESDRRDSHARERQDSFLLHLLKRGEERHAGQMGKVGGFWNMSLLSTLHSCAVFLRASYCLGGDTGKR
jgi:hypothetical protein